jgi:hypothetical protein
VEAYEGTGYLENPLLRAVIYSPSMPGSGFLLQKFNLYGVRVEAGRAVSGKKPMQIDVVNFGEVVKEATGRFAVDGIYTLSDLHDCLLPWVNVPLNISTGFNAYWPKDSFQRMHCFL